MMKRNLKNNNAKFGHIILLVFCFIVLDILTNSMSFIGRGLVEVYGSGNSGVATPRPTPRPTPIPTTHIHSYGSWITETKATCVSTGVKCRYCNSCGASETNVIPVSGHLWSSWDSNGEIRPDGYLYQIRTCEGCGKTEERRGAYMGYSTTTPRPSTPGACEHVWAAWLDVDETETQYTQMRMCEKCGTIQRQTLKKTTPEPATAAPTATPKSTPKSTPRTTPRVTYDDWERTTRPPTKTPTSRPTKTPTPSPTSRPTKTPTPGPTSRSTKTPTPGPTLRSTKTPTPSLTSRPTKTPTPSPTLNVTRTPSLTPTLTPTSTPTISPSPTPSPTPSPSPTISPSPTPSPSPTISPSPTPSPIPRTSPPPDNSSYVASQTISFETYGKIYDLQVNNSADPDWMNKVQGKDNNNKYTLNYIPENQLPFGQNGQNSNLAYKYAPKLGYTVSFNFKTKGRKTTQVDVEVKDFRFVSKDTGNVEIVDLYYTSGTKKIKIDSLNGRNISTRLTDTYYKVPAKEMTDSTRIYSLKEEKGENSTGSYQYGPYMYGITGPHNYRESVPIGNLRLLNLPHNLRLTFDNFVAEYIDLFGKDQNAISADANSADRVIGSVGRWYAGYILPASTIAVKHNQDANVSSNILKNGYILVSMQFIGKDSSGNQYLLYDGPKVNQISLPNGKTITPPAGVDPIVIYETDYRAQNDSDIGGVH